VVLTKDNKLKRGWKGETKCSFCDMAETIQHLFLECHVAKGLWNSLFLAFNIKPPKDISHMFGSWLRSFPPSLRNQIIVGVAALCWAIWLSRNDVVFSKTTTNSFSQLIFRGTYWIRLWSQLSKEKEGRQMKEACHLLEVLMLEVFGKRWWRHLKRIKT